MTTLTTAAPATGAEPAAGAAEPAPGVGEAAAGVLAAWNDTSTTWPAGDYVALVRRHVEASPDAPAVVSASLRLTYAQLEARSNRIARRLQAVGVTTGDRVGLLGPRSADFVVAVLGVLKAGAAVVPLDPVNPDQRLAYMVEDAAPEVVLVDGPIAHRLPEGTRSLQLDGAEFDRESSAPVDVDLGPDSISHLIYTSGSTGRPKAVLERHQALVNLVHWTGRAYGVQPGDRASWLSTPGFAVQIMEWMPYLGLGAAIHVGDVEQSTPEQLRDWLVAERITHTMLVAGLAERTWPLHWPQDTALRILVTTAERVHSWPPVDTPFRVVMTYGATETTNVLTCLDIGAGIDFTSQATDDETRRTRPVPVGRPIANMRAYILDEDDRPVGVGEVGRLHVAGHGVAAGYHGAGEMTARKFRANPLPGEPYDVLYDSGDLARYRPDGAVELLGRSDSQVKVRGHRVEIGEVETTVAAAPGVTEAVVVAREAGPGDTRLVGYVTPAAAAPGTIRSHLLRRLPPYMVPSTIVPLDALPRLPNGKVDLQRLPDPSAALRDAVAAELVLPRNEVEEVLAGLWRTLFNLEEVGIHDNFFELGGHSLLAFQLIDGVTRELGVQLSLPDLYARPTVAGLAELVEDRGSDGREGFADMAPIEPDPARHYDPFPLTDSQQALWIGRGDAVDLGNVGCHGYFEWESDTLDVERFKRAWRLLVERHAALRTMTRPDGMQQVLRDPPHYEIEVLDLRGEEPDAARAQVAALREVLSHQVMGDGQWPLFDIRLSLLPADAQGREFVRIHMSLDFLIADAWSYFQVLIPDLVQLYEDPDGLEPLRLTFRDYVLGAQERLASSDVYRRSELYWLGRIDTLPPAPELPARPADQPSLPIRFDRCEHRVDPETWTALKDRATEFGVTPSGLMTSIFAEVLRAYGDQERFTINFPIFNRIPLHPEVGKLIGDTTTTLLLAVDGDGEDFVTRAQSVQAELWAALEHRYFTGVQVLRELTRRRGTMMPAMPIVLTSLLGHPPRHFAASLAEPIYSISQTPQVSLDFQIFEVAGELQFNWDFLPALFPDGLVEEMFEGYCAILHALIDDLDAWRTRWFGVLPARVAAPDGHGAARPSAPAPIAQVQDRGEAWERYWAGIDGTGAEGNVLWDPGSDDEIARRLDEALRWMDRSLPVVDLGCGNGRFTRALAAHFPAAVGVDVSASAIARAVEESHDCPRAWFEVLDGTRPGEAERLAEEIGDANVFVRGVLHILDEEARQALARSLRALLGDRGTLIIVEPSYAEGAFGYVGYVGGTHGRTMDLVRPLEFAGVGASMRFGDEDLAEYFPAADWDHAESGTVEMHVLSPDADRPAMAVPGYYAVVRPT